MQSCMCHIEHTEGIEKHEVKKSNKQIIKMNIHSMYNGSHTITRQLVDLNNIISEKLIIDFICYNFFFLLLNSFILY